MILSASGSRAPSLAPVPGAHVSMGPGQSLCLFHPVSFPLLDHRWQSAPSQVFGSTTPSCHVVKDRKIEYRLAQAVMSFSSGMASHSSASFHL